MSDTYRGDFVLGDTVERNFQTFNSSRELVTFTGTTSIVVEKDGVAMTLDGGSTTLTKDRGSVVGSHRIAIDTSGDADFTDRADYAVFLLGAIIDGVTYEKIEIVSFSIGKRNQDANLTSQNGSPFSDSYQIRAVFGRDGANDRWMVTVYENGAPVSGAVATPTLTVTDDAGTPLFTAQALTRIDGTATYTLSTASQTDPTTGYVVQLAGTHGGGAIAPETCLHGSQVADVQSITGAASRARKLAALCSSALDGTVAAGGDATTVNLVLADSQTVGVDDLKGCVLVTIDNSQPPRVVLSNTAGTDGSDPVLTTESSTTIPDTTEVILTGYIKAAA
jgi:hypothetical protein